MKALSPLTLLVLIVLPASVSGQSRDARRAFQDGVHLAQIGDTASALARFNDAVTLDPTYAEAYFHKGLVHVRQSSARARDFEDRMIAQDAFTAAIKNDPGNPLYLLELGKLLLMQEIRVDARRVLERALEVAERADPATLAEVHYQLGRFREIQWLRFRDRHNLPLGIEQLHGDLAFADPEYVWETLERSGYDDTMGESELEGMLDHFHQALQSDPAHVGAATHLLAYYYDVGRTADFLAEARRFVRAAPREPRGYLAMGLGLHELGRDDEAAGAFEYAVELMDPETRSDFLAVSRLMREDDAEEFEALEGEEKKEATRRFWTAADPLYLTPSNELWAEYLARMAYADLRFGMPEYKVPGWRTDRGVIWVRYGRPARQASFAPSVTYGGDMEAVGKVTTVWSYGKDGPVFMFRQNPGFLRATFANDFRFYAEDYRSIQPTRFTAPSISRLLAMPAQVARFRGPAGAMDVEVHAAIPLDSLEAVAGGAIGTLESGLFVVDPNGREVKRLTEDEAMESGDGARRGVRGWRTTVTPDKAYVLSVEVRDPATWAAASYRERVSPRDFSAGQPSISDILLVTSLEPLVESPRDRSDFRMTAEPTLTFDADGEVGLYFELYNFLPDAEQFAAYDLELSVTVEEIYREGRFRQLLGDLADRWGLTREGDQAVTLRFQKENRVLARDMLPEFFTVTLDEPPPGRYGIELKVRDRNARVEMTASRTFEVRRQ